MDYRTPIQRYVNEEIELLQHMDIDAVNQVMNAIIEAYEKEATIYVFGNGGSGATASHMQNDFNKGISEYTEKKFRVCCLNDNISTVLAVANDIGFEDIFSFQLKNKLKSDDVVIGISGSGNSKNVLNAFQYAREVGATTIGWLGFDGGKAVKMTDITFHVKVNNMQLVEDLHLIINHLMMYVIQKEWNLKGH